jgi:hypothetical protein
MRKKKRKLNPERKIRKWVLEELERYMKIHKEHEKDLRYIG